MTRNISGRISEENSNEFPKTFGRNFCGISWKTLGGSLRKIMKEISKQCLEGKTLEWTPRRDYEEIVEEFPKEYRKQIMEKLPKKKILGHILQGSSGKFSEELLQNSQSNCMEKNGRDPEWTYYIFYKNCRKSFGQNSRRNFWKTSWRNFRKILEQFLVKVIEKFQVEFLEN